MDESINMVWARAVRPATGCSQSYILVNKHFFLRAKAFWEDNPAYVGATA